jgi:hypothetical protein
MMTCQDLAARIERLQPEAEPQEVARLCLLLANSGAETESLADDERLTKAWHEMGLRLQAAADQHAAMTEELESLSRSDPRQFGPEQIWTLVRAIKVQSQILQFYIGEGTIDV